MRPLKQRPPARLLVCVLAASFLGLAADSQAQNGFSTQLGAVRYPAGTDGVIDVTTLGAIPSDGLDDTAAINAALTYNRTHTAGNNGNTSVTAAWTIYFPTGTYDISGPLAPEDPANGNALECSVRMVGESRDGTILKVKAGVTFSPRSGETSAYVIQTGNSQASGGLPNAGFGNYLQNLTIDTTASAQSNLVGVRYDVANCGAMENIRIVGHPSSLAGLVLYSFCGPGLVKQVEIDGFRYGIYCEKASAINNIALEHITLTNQAGTGIYNTSKCLQIRDLTYRGYRPALNLGTQNAAVFLIHSSLTYTGSANPSPSAITSATGRPYVHLQATSVSGFSKVADFPLPTAPLPPDADYYNPPPPPGPALTWTSYQASYTAGNGPALNLPVKDVPLYNHTTLSDWWNVVTVIDPAKPVSNANASANDDAPGINRAILRTADVGSRKPVLYFPRGEYYLGTDVTIDSSNPNLRKIDFLFSHIFGPGRIVINGIGNSDKTLVLENMAIESHIVFDASDPLSRLVIRNHGSNGDITARPATGFTGAMAGELYVETAGANIQVSITKISAWMRALNREESAFINSGGRAWIFGDNVEDMAHPAAAPRIFTIAPIATMNFGQTEMVGGSLDANSWIHYPADGWLFTCDATSRVSATYAGVYRLGTESYSWAGLVRRDVNTTYGSFPRHIQDLHRGVEVLDVPGSVLEYLNPSTQHIRFFVPPFITNLNIRVTVERSGADVWVRFTTVAGLTYRIEYKDDLTAATWSVLAASVAGTGGIVTVPDAGAASRPKRFYRAMEF